MDVFNLVLTVFITVGGTPAELEFVRPIEYSTEKDCIEAMIGGYDPMRIGTGLIRHYYGSVEYEINYAVMDCKIEGYRV